jgi:Flp pilus assembly CpaF family ATPase
MESQIVSKPRYNILVQGKRGAGKTTRINMFLNLAMSLHCSDPRLVGIAQVFRLQNQKPIVLYCNIPAINDR